MFLFINLNQRNNREFIMNEFRPKMPPFGIAYVSSALKMIGVKSMLHDDNLHMFSDDKLTDFLEQYRGEIQAIGLTSISTTLKQLERVARISKAIMPDVPVIVGGASRAFDSKRHYPV